MSFTPAAGAAVRLKDEALFTVAALAKRAEMLSAREILYEQQS